MKNQLDVVQESDSYITIYGMINIILCVVAAFMRVTIFARGILLIATIIAIPFILFTVIGNRMFVISKFQSLLILFFLCSALSSIAFGGFGVNSIKIQIACILVYYYFLNKREEEMLKKALYVVAIFFIYAYFFKFEYYGGGIRRYISLQQGVYLDPNLVGGSFIIPTALSVEKIIDDKSVRKKVMNIVFIILSVYVNILGGSRGTLISMLISAGIVFLLKARYDSKKIIYMFLVLLVLGVLFMRYSYLFPKEILFRFTASSLEQSEGSGRVELLSRAINYMLNDDNIVHFLFGYGLGSAKYIIGKGIHNTAMDYLWGLGISGFVFYLLLHYCIFCKCIKSKSALSIACLISSLIWSMTLSLSNEIMYWINLYCCIVFAQAHYIECKD